VTAAVFVGGTLREVWRLETGLGHMVVAYAERRKKIAEGHHPSDHEVGTKLKRLRERSRKLEVARKAAKFIERLAEEHNAVVVVGRITQRAKEKMGRDKGRRLRYRIHQWSVRTLVRLLEEKPIQVVEVSETGTSSRTPSGVRITFSPLVIRTAVRGGGGVWARPPREDTPEGGEGLGRGVGAGRLGGREHRSQVPSDGGALWRRPRRGPMRRGRRW
jgi:putative transposase